MGRYSALRNQYVRGEDVRTYVAAGAITISDGVHAIRATAAAAMTLAAPGAGDEGTQITVTARTAFAHTLTIAGGIGGRGITTDVVTFAAVGDTITLIADNLVWVPMGAPYGATIA
ncbi:MAG TPA: hypothetical protein VNJ03_14995 [Vicinamibacterales bacterium]|nr:hypothetical protein [Vicinamibacterales bacterium]